jgi:hypothetical protein
LLIASSQGGAGQNQLRYAEHDAARVGEVLTMLAGYQKGDIESLVQPSVDELRAALERLRERLAANAAAGEQSEVFLYYSGHARADALSLGQEALPLSELRERITTLPATISIVVLDACQSGAFSRVKGAARAADFSYNSVQRLNVEGVAVMASSSAVELSQESDQLESSYFTHHLLVALRGAGDADRDGRVTLSEAYRYAYNHTLAATALTAVGEQHVTLETDFRGKGEVALTYPGRVTSRLRVPAEFEGQLLLQQLPSWSVLAELQKAKGEPIELALPPGEYAATVRQSGGLLLRCALTLEDGKTSTFSSFACRRIDPPVARAKGVSPAIAAPPDTRDEAWVLEASVGLGDGHREDSYQTRLYSFGFLSQDSGTLRYTLSAGRRVQDHLVLGISFANLDTASFKRENEGLTQHFSWSSHALGAFAQGDLSTGKHRLLNLFVRAGIGVAWATTSFDRIEDLPPFADRNPSLQETTATTRKAEQSFASYYLAAGGGLQVMPDNNVGFHFEARYLFAPAIDNLTGESHDVGGFAILLGMRLRTWQ